LVGISEMAGSEKLELLHSGCVRRMDHVHLDGEIVVNKLGRARAVSQDPPDARRGQEDVLKFFGCEKLAHRSRVAQVELIPCTGDQSPVSGIDEPAADGGPDQSSMTRDIDSRIGPHQLSRPAA
jgi:hypothetical protein